METMLQDPASKSVPIPGVFENLDVTPANHFRLHFFAAVYSLIRYLRELSLDETDPLAALFEKHPFLAWYFSELLAVMPGELSWDDGRLWWEEAINIWASGASVWLPIKALGDAAEACMLAGLVEEDARFGTLFADLQAPLPHRRPTLELLGRVAPPEDTLKDGWSFCKPMLDSGLLVASNQEAPRSEWALKVPALLWDALKGYDPAKNEEAITFHAADTFLPLADLVLPPQFHRQIAQVPTLIQTKQLHAFILRGVQGSDQLGVVGSIARTLNCNTIEIGPKGLEKHGATLGMLCHLHGAMPVFTFELVPGEIKALPALPGFDGPVALLLNESGGVRGPMVNHALTLNMPRLSLEERHRVWQQAFGAQPVENLESICQELMIPSGYIKQIVPKSITRSRLEARKKVTAGDIRAVCDTLNREQLETMAEHLDVAGTWQDLIVNPTAQQRLEELTHRCRYREVILDRLGPAFGANMNRGVRALFTGPSGTGKTLAAKVLASELGKSLYRVDLAAVINKYIGETEKNLHRILSAAESLDVILLLDEGDALLGARTDVKSANDRYANLETNYLLQRLEHYNGIVLITTNLSNNIDKAFERRMDVNVPFVLPNAEERLKIWQLHLPAHHEVSDGMLERVAVRCELTGGRIRNAAMLAALLSLNADTPGPNDRLLYEALDREYVKVGAVNPLKKENT